VTNTVESNCFGYLSSVGTVGIMWWTLIAIHYFDLSRGVTAM